MSRINGFTPTLPSAKADSKTDLRDVDIYDFLTLMITELQNQDPLNPMDNAQMLEQIGQIRQISATSQSLAEGSSQQAASIEESSASLEQLTSMTKRNADNAHKANSIAREARHAAESGVSDMQAMNTAMQRSPMTIAPIRILRGSVTAAPRQRATAIAIHAIAASEASVTDKPPHAPK